MKKQIFTLLFLISIALTAQCQWTYLRSLPSGEYPSTFDGVGYASMKYGLSGKTQGHTQSQTRTVTVYKIDESTGSMTSVYSTNNYGVSGSFMVTEKKLGKVYRFGNYQGYPSTHVLDSSGVFSVIGIHPQGFTCCFSAYDENHLYSIFMNEYNDFIFNTRINGVNVLADTFTTFGPLKIDFPATNCGYMSIVENSTGTYKILKSSSDLLTWNPIYETTSTISDIVFDELNTGYAVVQPGIIIKTTDGGITWDTIYHNDSKEINKIDVVNEDIVFACGNSGLILRSLNGGVIWTQDAFPHSIINLNQIIMFDQNNGYAMERNICYRLRSSTVPAETVHAPQFNITPNPSIGETKISSNSMIRSIEIIDINGKTILTKEINESNVTLSYYPEVTGTYFIRVTFSDGEVQTEKIVFAR
jgi:hypothetical protein